MLFQVRLGLGSWSGVWCVHGSLLGDCGQLGGTKQLHKVVCGIAAPELHSLRRDWIEVTALVSSVLRDTSSSLVGWSGICTCSHANQGGPPHHSGWSVNAVGDSPLEAQSAGFCSVGTCFQDSGGTRFMMAEMRLAQRFCTALEFRLTMPEQWSCRSRHGLAQEGCSVMFSRWLATLTVRMPRTIPVEVQKWSSLGLPWSWRSLNDRLVDRWLGCRPQLRKLLPRCH